MSQFVAQALREEFGRFESRLNGHKHSPFYQRRVAALHAVADAGFPQANSEDWKYTDISQILETPFRLANCPAVPALSPEKIYQLFPRLLLDRCVVFVNGRFDKTLSRWKPRSAGARFYPLAELFASDPDIPENDLRRILLRLAGNSSKDNIPFAGLNTAFLEDGAVVIADSKSEENSLIHVLFLTTEQTEPVVSYPRLLIVAAEGSRLSAIETHISLGSERVLTSAVSEIFVDENAVVDYFQLNLEGESACHVSSVFIEQEKNSRFSASNLTLGGALVRNEVRQRFCGTGGECSLYGLAIADREQHVDNWTALDHAEPGCESRELYKGVFGGKSRGVFTGTILVRPHAQKTNAFQAARSLLLSPHAVVDARPQLKIWADDVRCSHGATVGQLDDEARYYLRTRGISDSDARQMLIHAFVDEVIQSFDLNIMRDCVNDLVMAKLNQIFV